MRLWAALALAAALAAAKKTESSQDTKYEIDKLQALVDSKKTLFDSLEATLRRASESDGAAAEEAKPDADSDAVVDISSDKPGGEEKKKKNSIELVCESESQVRPSSWCLCQSTVHVGIGTGVMHQNVHVVILRE